MPISTTYTISNTQGSLSFQMSAGSSNGPNELSQSTDLTYYGYGRTGWGQQVDQNFYSLLENFACTQLAGPNVVPNTSATLGGTFGINHPVLGQQWFNLTSSEMYVCTDVSNNTWRHLLSETYADSKYLSIAGANVIKLDGSNTPMTGPLLLNGDPTVGSPAHTAATKNYVDSAISALTSNVGGIYVSKLGDTMTGTLILTTSTPNDAFSQVAIDGVGVNTYPVLSMGRLNGSSTQSIVRFYTSGSLSGSPTIDAAITASNGIVGSPGNGNITITGFLLTDGRAVTQPNQVTTKTYVDSAIATATASITGTTAATYVKKSGDVMSGQLNMGGNVIAGLGYPVNSTDAARVDWTKAMAYMPSGLGATHQIWISTNSPSGGNNGDIWIRY